MAHTLNSIIPKLPSRNLAATSEFYIQKLKFRQVGGSYPDYLMIMRDNIEMHFFLFETLNELENYGQVYIRVDNIENLYNDIKSHFPSLKPPFARPWGQTEMYLLDPDHNSLTFGEQS